MRAKKIAVIGAGPAGVTAAYRLAQAGQKVTLYEASDTVGGMARSLKLWGQTVDIGPHRFFSGDRRVNELWLEVVKNDYAMVDRKTRIFYKQKFFSYPLEPLDALRKLGLREAFSCVVSYVKQQLFSPPKGELSFEDWVTRRFGRRLFEIFFKGYSEKLWGIPCSEIDSDFASQRIKKLSLWEVTKNALTGGRKNNHKSLVDSFAYPKQGSGVVYERMASAINATDGCSVKLGVKISGLQTKDGKVTGIKLPDDRVEACDAVVSTMPITQLIKALGGVPPEVQAAAEQLTFRNTLLVYFLVDGVDLFPDQWLYIQAGDLNVGRITNFRNWVPSLYGNSRQTILASEYWCYDSDALWSESDSKIIEATTKELISTGLVGDKKISDAKVVRVPRCYPVYRKRYKEHLKVVTGFLDGIQGLLPIGRYGAFKYNNQDHSILMGMLAADSIVSGMKDDLWKVNTDYTSYQEETRITDTGLKKAA